MRESELSRKLRRGFRLPPTERSGDVRGGDVRGSLRRRHARLPRRKLPRVELPPGEEIENDAGRCYLRRLTYDVDTVHGGTSLGTCASAGPAGLARLAELARDEAFRSLRPDACLFLDTETTGLAGGAGTMVFLCGLGFFNGQSLIVEQVFLRSFADEPAALQHVAERLTRYPTLVTYVGKSFDRHRLHARMAVNKIKSTILEAPHLDLYYLARRAWGKELQDVRLQTVEREILGFHRPDDLPGAEAPAAFLAWVRDGSGPVDRVFEHNRLDVLSLVALLGRLT